MDLEQAAADYARVERAILFLAQQHERQPSLAELAAHVGLSPHHLQRLFGRWAGITPKRFLQFVTKEHAKALLAASADVLTASCEAGLSGPGRLHDLFVACEALTPGEFKRQGEGLAVAYGFHPSPFGECLLAVTRRGICGLAFVDEGGRSRALETLAARLPRADLHEDVAETRPYVERAFAPLAAGRGPLHLLLKGTNFQLKVWEALLRIPPGRVASYRDIAVAVGAPGAARAVGQAVGANPVAYLIPCHRVIRSAGDLGGYHWGLARKQAMLGWEAAQAASSGSAL